MVIEALCMIWVVGALAIWIHYKIIHLKDKIAIEDAPPQRTFVGALMWPIYLGSYLINKASELLGLAPKE
jgi:hypothetical protein